MGTHTDSHYRVRIHTESKSGQVPSALVTTSGALRDRHPDLAVVNCVLLLLCAIGEGSERRKKRKKRGRGGTH